MLKILFAFLTALLGGSPNKATPSAMNEGDMHSGPHGYSPNTAYSDTEYGDHDWEAEER